MLSPQEADALQDRFEQTGTVGKKPPATSISKRPEHAERRAG